MPKIKHIQAFTQVLVTNNFDDTSTKNEQARMETPLSHYTFMGYFQTLNGSCYVPGVTKKELGNQIII